MKMDITQAHLYTESLLNCLLCSHHDKEGREWIRNELNEYYSNPLIHFFNDITDFGYISETDDQITIAISGTKGSYAAWRDDCRILFPVNGIHRGINESWYDLFAGPIRQYLYNKKKPVKLFGHSRGDGVSKRGALWLREELEYPDVEQCGFCGLKIFTDKGIKRAKKVKLRSTRLWIDKSDIVDDVGVYGGKQYGYSVKLPQVTDNPIMGHAYSNVCKSLIKLFDKWGYLKEISVVENISHYATI